MNDALVTMAGLAVPPDVEDFAVEKGVNHFMSAVIDLARQAFPWSVPQVSVGQDAEDETHRYIALDIEVGNRDSDELLAGQRIWSAELRRICPARFAVYFVLGWR